MEDLYRSIHADPLFHALEARRRRLAWTLTALVLLAYFAFILTIAFAPHWLAVPLSGDGPVTWGIVLGLAVIVVSFLLTGVYVRLANKQFDPLTASLLAAHHEARDRAS